MVEVLLPDRLKNEIEKFLSSVSAKKVKLDSREVIISSMSPSALDFTNFAGKNTEIIYSIVFGYSKKSFDVFKVGESLYVSTNYQPHYSNIRRQKEEIENNIKAQLAQIATAITDTQLISHDYRKYKHFVDIFRELDEINKKLSEEKDENKKKELQKRKRELEITLRNIYIDQVDVYTGDFSIANMARTRWTTFIADFLSLEDEKTPEDVLKKLPNITMAEAIQLAKKNSLFLYWLDEFRKVVFEREAELRKLLIMRKNSIENYKNMLRPLIARYLAIKEEPVFFTSSSLAFVKSATYPLLVDSTKFWMIKAIPPFMKEEERVIPQKINPEKAGIIIDELKNLVKNNLSSIETNVMPQEPSIDRVVVAGIEVINENFGTNFDLNDILEIRESLVKKATSPSLTKERWKLSPYYVFVEISLDRALLRTYTGIEIEDFYFEIRPYLISQNIAMLMYLQTKALDKYLESQINSFFGESLEKTVEVSVGNQKKEVKVLLDINFLDKVFEEDISKEKSKRYEIVKKYSEAFEREFIKKRYLLYEKSVVDEYFFDYVVQTKLDIDRTIASSFGFPI
ncbi:MAG: hypothetical protein QXP34_03330 [Candidatus Aenigmatarchaeota archaeon]